METPQSRVADVLEKLAQVERRADQLARDMAAFEASGAWAADGSESFNAWLCRHGRMTPAGARQWQRRGRLVR